ncbi:MAG: ABC transporter substrate-binding protein [Elusimicrobia bacterium]|nr:ABC transporter substrate-binding protein [Elusimicrobiota bacterium]
MWAHLWDGRKRIVVSLVMSLLVWPGPAAGQKRGGTAVLAIDSNPLTLNPAITSGDPDHMVGEKVYGALIYLDDNFSPRPDLALRWEVAPDGLSYRFDLRPNVKWHDGQPFTSADVKYTFEEVLAKYHPLSKNTFQRIASVDTPDPLKVVIRMKEPFGPFLSILFSFNAPIIPKHIYGGTDVLTNAANSRPVGTGPFKFHEWIRGDRITLVRNDAYYHPVQLDRLILKIIPDAAARTLAFESGDVDYIADYYLAKSDVARLEKLRDSKVRRGGDLPINTLLGFNIRQRSLAVPEVRHAIATAIDRKLIVDKARFGLGIPGRSEIDGHFTWAYNPKIDYSVIYAFNPSKARTLLDTAGYRPGPDGKRVSLRLIYNVARPVLAQIAEIMKSQLADVGIELRLEAVERAVWIDRVWMKYDFDLHLFEGGTFGDPALGVQRWYLCADEVRRIFAVNATGYCNPMVDELFHRAATEVKVSDRARYYFQVQEILARDLPHLVLIENENVDVAKSYLKGIWAGKMQYSQWEGVWIDK